MPSNSNTIEKWWWRLRYNIYGMSLGFGWGTTDEAEELDYDAHPYDAFDEDWEDS